MCLLVQVCSTTPSLVITLDRHPLTANVAAVQVSQVRIILVMLHRSLITLYGSSESSLLDLYRMDNYFSQTTLITVEEPARVLTWELKRTGSNVRGFRWCASELEEGECKRNRGMTTKTVTPNKK